MSGPADLACPECGHFPEGSLHAQLEAANDRADGLELSLAELVRAADAQTDNVVRLMHENDVLRDGLKDVRAIARAIADHPQAIINKVTTLLAPTTPEKP